MSSKYSVVSGSIFGFVAGLQAVRALSEWPLLVGSFEIPVWCSWVAALGAAAMSVWGFRSNRS